MKMVLNRPKNLNFASSDWTAFEEWAKEQLDEAYKRLAGLNTSDMEVRQLQGRATLLQQLLDFRTQTAAFGPR